MSSENSQDPDSQLTSLVDKAIQEVREEFLRRLEETRAHVVETVRQKQEALSDEPSSAEEEDAEVESGSGIQPLLEAVAAIDRARSQSAVLVALLEGAAGFASHTAFLLADEAGFSLWSGQGFDRDDLEDVRLDVTEESSWSVAKQGSGSQLLDSAACAELTERIDDSKAEEGVFIPMVLRDHLAGGLYAGRVSEAPAIEIAALQLLTYVASQALETLPLRERASTATLRLAGQAPEGTETLGLLISILRPEDVVEEEEETLVEEDLPAAEPEELMAVPAAPETEAAPEEASEADEELPTEEVSEQEEEAAAASTEHFEFAPAEEPQVEAPEIEKQEIGEQETAEPDAPDAPADEELLPWQTEPAESPEEDRVIEEAAETADLEEAAEEEPEVTEEKLPESAEAAEPEEATEGEEATEEALEVEPEVEEAVEAEEATEQAPEQEPEAEEAVETGDTQKISTPEAFESAQVSPPENVEGPGWAFDQPQVTDVEDDTSAQHDEARRLARLLVTEIKLYNEGALEDGLRNGNILQALHDDIQRSRLIYEERTSDEVRSDGDYFRDELVRILADGNEEALGG